ncbi:MAG: hypothetical protein JWM44_4052 [Bacilli bacterium]|nr:hypothetical protein [Bacilli bacterium]
MILKMNPGSVPIQQVKQVTNNVPNEQIKTQISESVIEDIICARCNANMVRRSSTRGEFLGCSNFPKCRITITLNS